MRTEKLKNWLLTSTTGLLLIAFGLISILVPEITILVLTIYFAISILLGGIVLFFIAYRIRNSSDRWKYVMIEGAIGILLGAIIVLRPEVAAAIFVTLIGVWALLIGILFIIYYFNRILPAADKIMLLMLGIISTIVGILLMINPFEGSRALAVIIGAYAIFYGFLSILSKHKFNLL